MRRDSSPPGTATDPEFPPSAAKSSGAALFEEHHDLVERLLTFLTRRKRLSPDEAEEFSSWARLKLLEDDCRRLRKHQGPAETFPAYLQVTVANLLRDWRTGRYGKWRTSTAARRMGVVAERLDVLVNRDGFSYDEAVAKLRRHHGVALTDERMEAIYVALPVHPPRRVEGEEQLGALPVEPEADDRVLDRERRRTAARVLAVYRGTLATFDPETQLVFRLRFERSLGIATIARRLGIEQKPLYRRMEGCVRDLRQAFEQAGLAFEDLRPLLGWEELDLGFSNRTREFPNVDPFSQAEGDERG